MDKWDQMGSNGIKWATFINVEKKKVNYSRDQGYAFALHSTFSFLSTCIPVSLYQPAAHLWKPAQMVGKWLGSLMVLGKNIQLW